MSSRPAMGLARRVTDVGNGARVGVRAALLACLGAVLAWGLVAGLAPGRAIGASPSPSPAPTLPSPGPAGGTADLTGHWAVAGTSGFDIVQDGSRIDGTSVAGIRFSGTVSGSGATFRFWSGSSFAKADPDDRGTGSFRLTPDGRTLVVSWHNEKPSATSLDPVFTAVRVITIVDDPAAPHEPATPTWFTAENLQLAQWLAQAVEVPLETVISYLIVVGNPSPAQLRSDVQAYEAMLYLFRDWDRAHGIKPRPVP